MPHTLVLIIKEDGHAARILAEFFRARACSVRIVASISEGLLFVQRAGVSSVIVVPGTRRMAEEAQRIDGKRPPGPADGELFLDASGQLIVRSPKDAAPSEILGSSAAMEKVRERVRAAARSNLNPLITGETGTGKDLVTRAIHRLSSRGGRPLITYNCAVASAHLFPRAASSAIVRAHSRARPRTTEGSSNRLTDRTSSSMSSRP